jgi:hypothetical protein
MIVSGALCWWNERPEDLDKCVRGLGHVADRVVALDGAYVRYPGATPASDPAQADAIRNAARDVGLDCLILTPDKLWAGQVEKRSFLLGAASIGSDWIVTVDADHVITANREHVRFILERVHEDALEVAYRTPINPNRKMKESAAGIWHIEQTVEVQYIPLFWRVLAGMQVEQRHWWYSAMKPGGRIWLWGGDGRYPGIYRGRMEQCEVEHRTLFRTPAQIKASRAFLNDREMIVERTGQEDWVPGLPDPVYNDKRMPA